MLYSMSASGSMAREKMSCGMSLTKNENAWWYANRWSAVIDDIGLNEMSYIMGNALQ